jgi:DNA-nicking Smr family endonuclease
MARDRRHDPPGEREAEGHGPGASPGENPSPFPEPVPLPIDGTLDLHAFRPSEVGDLVPEWIEACHAAGFRELRIVHGKGTGALRQSVEVILARHPLVLSFRTAQEDAGGWGATLVQLR